MASGTAPESGQNVQLVGVVDDEQQFALLKVTAQRCPGRPQKGGGLPYVGDIHQMAERPKRDQALGRGAGDPVDDCRRVALDDGFDSQAGQRRFAAAVGSEYDGAGQFSSGPCFFLQGSTQLLQGGRMLRNFPSNRHRRILVRARAAAAR